MDKRVIDALLAAIREAVNKDDRESVALYAGIIAREAR